MDSSKRHRINIKEMFSPDADYWGIDRNPNSDTSWIEDVCSEYGVYYILDCFENNENPFLPLINPAEYQKALDFYTKGVEIPEVLQKKIYQWIGIIRKNVYILETMSSMCGHRQYGDNDEIIYYYLSDDDEQIEEYCSSHGINNNERDIVESIFEENKFYEWKYLECTDFGVEPMMRILSHFDDNSTSPEDALIIVNKMLDAFHHNGDLSQIFINGGAKTLSTISNHHFYVNECKSMCSSNLNEMISNVFSKVLNESKGVSNVVMRMYQSIREICHGNEGTDRNSGTIVKNAMEGGARVIEIKNFFFISWIEVRLVKSGRDQGGTGAKFSDIESGNNLYDRMSIDENGRIVCHNADGTEIPFIIVTEYGDIDVYGQYGDISSSDSMSSTLAHELMHIYRFYVKIKNTKNPELMHSRENRRGDFYQKCTTAMNSDDNLLKSYAYFMYITDNDEIAAEQQGGYAYQSDGGAMYRNSNLMSRSRELKTMYRNILSFKDNVEAWKPVCKYFHGIDDDRSVRNMMNSFYRKAPKMIAKFDKLGKRQFGKVATDRINGNDYGYEQDWNNRKPASDDKSERLRRLQALRQSILANRDKIEGKNPINENFAERQIDALKALKDYKIAVSRLFDVSPEYFESQGVPYNKKGYNAFLMMWNKSGIDGMLREWYSSLSNVRFNNYAEKEAFIFQNARHYSDLVIILKKIAQVRTNLRYPYRNVKLQDIKNVQFAVSNYAKAKSYDGENSGTVHDAVEEAINNLIFAFRYRSFSYQSYDTAFKDYVSKIGMPFVYDYMMKDLYGFLSNHTGDKETILNHYRNEVLPYTYNLLKVVREKYPDNCVENFESLIGKLKEAMAPITG